jgi:hypothetical protein
MGWREPERGSRGRIGDGPAAGGALSPEQPHAARVSALLAANITGGGGSRDRDTAANAPRSSLTIACRDRLDAVGFAGFGHRTALELASLVHLYAGRRRAQPHPYLARKSFAVVCRPRDCTPRGAASYPARIVRPTASPKISGNPRLHQRPRDHARGGKARERRAGPLQAVAGENAGNS